MCYVWVTQKAYPMKEIGYFKLTFMRWGSYFLLLSVVQLIVDQFWPDSPEPMWRMMLGALLMAVFIPWASGWHKTRKVFVQEVGKASDGAEVVR